MLGKRVRPNDDDKDSETKLRRDVTNLFTSGTLGASRVQGLVDGIADLPHGEEYLQFQALSSSAEGDANVARKLRNKLKSKAWPPLYFADVTFLHRTSGEEVT